MKPHQRIRKTIKWGGAAVTVLLGVVWIGSGWVSASVPVPPPKGHRERWSLSHGSLVMATYPSVLPVRRGLPWGRDVAADFATGEPVRFAILWTWSRSGAVGIDFVSIPLWPLILIAAFPSLLMFHVEARSRRLVQSNRCPGCAYDRAGIAAGSKCPECGKPGCSP
jgi:hypothetical protein